MFEKCPKCGYTEPQEPINEIPLEYYWQRHPRYKGMRINNTNTSLQNYGCFTFCLAFMAKKDPIEVHNLLSKNGGYSKDLIVSYAAAEILGLKYHGKNTNINAMPAINPTIKEVSLGKSQHFTIRFNDGKQSVASKYGTYIFDTWTGLYKPINEYYFRSYRLFER